MVVVVVVVVSLVIRRPVDDAGMACVSVVVIVIGISPRDGSSAGRGRHRR
jgi:hypothetical protein